MKLESLQNLVWAKTAIFKLQFSSRVPSRSNDTIMKCSADQYTGSRLTTLAIIYFQMAQCPLGIKPGHCPGLTQLDQDCIIETCRLSSAK